MFNAIGMAGMVSEASDSGSANDNCQVMCYQVHPITGFERPNKEDRDGRAQVKCCLVLHTSESGPGQHVRFFLFLSG